jgi:hypothetical protein
MMLVNGSSEETVRLRRPAGGVAEHDGGERAAAARLQQAV